MNNYDVNYNSNNTPLDLMYGATNLIWDIANFNPYNQLTNIFSNLKENTITSHTKFEILNNEGYERMIQLNKVQKDYLTETSGQNAVANGLSDNFSIDINSPEEWEGYNYLDFAKTISSNENMGMCTTQVNVRVDNEKLTALDNKFNRYPMEVSSASNQTWKLNDDKNSILYKTQNLFNQNKINTIISRFGTNTENNGNNVQYNGQVATSFGESRGRNLLTKDAEKSNTSYNVNGYQNPYCRTWTNHYQYDRYNKTIRPFKNGSSLKEVNTWNSSFTKQKTGDMKWGWRDNNSGYDKSVMSDGRINFAPMYKGGGPKNIHTRQCMFSIENLAWKDFNPYQFENCLSWEQRGPNGGRIMWFPPYGLTFNETTQARWQSHQFIGRGEEVYTYQDTVRSGTLSFLMVVDHPSIIDYVFGSHNKSAKDDLNDNDIHRYFAGCDQETLKEKAAPTPLTDEYSGIIEFGPLDVHDDLKIKGQENKPPQSTPKKIIFQWYFPNNYSGHFDNNTLNDDANKVSSVKYTLMGTAGGIKRDMKTNKKKWDTLDDSVLKSGISNEGFIDGYSTGYLMGFKIDDNKLIDDYLLPQQTPRFTKKGAKGPMKNIANKGRFYRVDYDSTFQWPKNEDCYRNTLDQECLNKRKVTNNYNYNVEVPDKSENEDEKIYSFLYLSCALMEVSEKQTNLLSFIKTKFSNNLNESDENSEYKQLVQLFTNIKEGTIKPKTIIAQGYSSVQQATTDVGKKRNEYLAKQRAQTIQTLFKDSGIYNGDVQIEIKDFPSQGKDNKDENGVDETKNRRAELIIELETESQENTTTTKQGDNKEKTQQQKIDEYNEKHKYIGYNKTDSIIKIDEKEYYLYKEDGVERFWYNIDDYIGREKKPEIDPTLELEKELEEETKIIQTADSEISVINTAKEKKEAWCNVLQENTDVKIIKLEQTSDVKSPKITLKIVGSKLTKDVQIQINQKGLNSNFKVDKTSMNKDYVINGTNNSIDITYKPVKGDKHQCTLILKYEDNKTRNVVIKGVAYKEEKVDTTTEEVVVKQPVNWRLYNEDIIKSGKYAGQRVKERKDEKNNIRYDQEYYFFKKLESEDPIVFKNLIDKLQYFDPTFHSMTPEGFNGRLTFLQQCMRQGDTLTEIEHMGENGQTSHVVTAKNLAFGRPPFCILRVGDFYNQTIIIENMSINYDFDGGIKWDLNSEGIGVQPLLAQVQLSIKLIGGGDMSGPIRRLQNAMSFNYYANTSLYDNRADRYEYDINHKTAQKGELKKENCYVYDAFTTQDSVKYEMIKTGIGNKRKKQLESDINFGKEVAPVVYKTNFYGTEITFVDDSQTNLTYGEDNVGYKGYTKWEDLTYTDKPKPKENKE